MTSQLVKANPHRGRNNITKAQDTEEREFFFHASLTGNSLRRIAQLATAHFGYSISKDTVARKLDIECESIVGPARETYRQVRLEQLQEQERRLLETIASPPPLIAGGAVVLDDDSNTVPDHNVVLSAERQLLKCNESMRALLGLNAPTQINVDARHVVYDFGDNNL